MYCGNCGHEVKEGIKFCPNCGKKIGDMQTLPVDQDKNDRVVGAIMLIMGIVGLVYSLITFSNDMSTHFYTYTAPLSAHEWVTIFIGLGGIIVTLIGIILIVSGNNHEKTS